MWKWLLVSIIVAGFIFRVVGISNHPTGFTPDEASFGYDAYSILKTGKDQWGKPLPLVFKSFGDDKLPVYTYLAIPSIAVFGLNEFAVRLPNAILGALAILVVYFLTKELFKDEKLSLLSSFLIAISPWHIMLSRGAFEANLTTFFLPLGMLFFLWGIKNRNFLILSAIVFGINLFTYHTARILTPLIVLFLIWQNWKEIKKNIFHFGIIFAIFLVPAIYLYMVNGSRVASSGIFDLNFSDDRYLAQVIHEPSIISKFFYNRPVYIVRQFVTNYFSYFSPQFLLTNGAAEGTYGMVPGIGVLYFTEIVFLIGFVWKVAKERSKEINLLIFWILISPIPAALTKGPGYAANRIAFVMPATQIILAIGALFVYEKIKKEWRKLFVVGYSILFFFSFIYVFEKYWAGEIINQSPAMIYGTSSLVNKLSEIQTKNNQIIISKNISEPQIYLAFYTKMDPVEYQHSSMNWTLVNGWVDQQGSYNLGKYSFRNINYSVDFKLKNTILVGTPQDFPAEIKPDFAINYPNLKPAYYIVLTK